jgi:hypothetical protein
MKKLLVVLGMGLICFSAFARGYGMGGCGLGSMILGDKKGMMQIFASTTNGSSGSQTFGISSGTSNCLDGSGKTATVFIEANKVALANDIARGQGETLSALSAIYQCQNTQNFGSTLQSNYKSIFSSTDASVEKIQSTIQNLSIESCRS